VETIKKSHTVLWGVFLITLILSGLFVLGCKEVKTQDDIVKMLGKELQIGENSDTSISFVAEYEIGENSLLWFSVQSQHMTNYRVVECNKIANGKYQVKKTHKPMTYAQDIVHIVFDAEDIFLINNFSCQSIVYRNKSGDVISQTDILPNELPYIFILKPLGNESICDFLDERGNSIR